MAVARFPGLGHAEEHVVGVEHGEHEAAPSVEEAARAGRTWTGSDRGAESEPEEAGAVAPLDELRRGQGRVTIRARDEVIEAAIRMMEEGLDYLLDSPCHQHRLVHRGVHEAPRPRRKSRS